MVYFPTIWYEERHLRIEYLAQFDKEMMDKSTYEAYLLKTGRKRELQEDTFRDFITI